MNGIIKSINEITIYESVEGIKSVYTSNPSFNHDVLQRLPLWIDILEVSENNISLKDLISKIEEVYYLVKDQNG